MPYTTFPITMSYLIYLPPPQVSRLPVAPVTPNVQQLALPRRINRIISPLQRPNPIRHIGHREWPMENLPMAWSSCDVAADGHWSGVEEAMFPDQGPVGIGILWLERETEVLRAKFRFLRGRVSIRCRSCCLLEEDLLSR